MSEEKTKKTEETLPWFLKQQINAELLKDDQFSGMTLGKLSEIAKDMEKFVKDHVRETERKEARAARAQIRNKVMTFLDQRLGRVSARRWNVSKNSYIAFDGRNLYWYLEGSTKSISEIKIYREELDKTMASIDILASIDQVVSGIGIDLMPDTLDYDYSKETMRYSYPHAKMEQYFTFSFYGTEKLHCTIGRSSYSGAIQKVWPLNAPNSLEMITNDLRSALKAMYAKEFLDKCEFKYSEYQDAMAKVYDVLNLKGIE